MNSFPKQVSNMKVLLPIDVLHPYKELIQEVERVVPVKGADIKLLYVAESTNKFEHVLKAAGKTASELDTQLKNKAAGVLEEIGQLLKPSAGNVKTQVMVGSPAEAIELIEREESFDVIALAAECSENHEQHPLGSTAGNIVKHAPGTIVVLRPKKGVDKPLGKVLMGLDGSEQALSGLRRFVTQFGVVDRKIEVALVHVVSIVGIWKFASPTEFVASIEDNLNMAGEAILASGERVLSESGLKPSEMFIRTGDVASELIRAAKDVNADAIVCGARGKGAVEAFIMGSSSYKLSQRSPYPLVIVK
jgi:nucleotide-binding universal stress UspA family protein